MKAERNIKLSKFKEFEYRGEFYIHFHNFLQAFFDNELISEGVYILRDKKYHGIRLEVYPSAHYFIIPENIRKQTISVKTNIRKHFPLINSGFSYTASSGKGYIYPWDRNEFADTPLGMEQKAAYSLVIIQFVLKFLEEDKN